MICLDVLRAMVQEPASRCEVFFDEIEETAPRRAAARRRRVRKLKAELSDFEGIETRARAIVERMALALQGALLVRDGDPAVADAFCASRLGGDWGRAFGTLPAGVDVRAHHRAPHAAAGTRLSAARINGSAIQHHSDAKSRKRLGEEAVRDSDEELKTDAIRTEPH